MTIARIVQQLTVAMPTRVGLLAEVTGALKDAGINITAITAYEDEDQAVFMMATSDNDAAARTLLPLGAEVAEEDVVALEIADEAGALHEVAQRVAQADINIDWMYATTTSAATTALCIIQTEENDRVLSLF